VALPLTRRVISDCEIFSTNKQKEGEHDGTV